MEIRDCEVITQTRSPKAEMEKAFWVGLSVILVFLSKTLRFFPNVT